MKNYFKITILLFLFSAPLFAQKPHGWTKEKWDEVKANKAVRLSLESNKDLLEANEAATLTIHVLIPPDMDEDGIPKNEVGDVLLPIGEIMPYKPTNWRIVEGGGNLITIDEISASYTSPAQAPANRTMTISVDLIPTGPNEPKIVLLKTLHFSENETSIVINLPEIDYNSTKFVTKNDGGVKVPTMQGMDPRVAGHISPDLQAKMAQAQQAMASAGQQSGYNLSAITSNAMSVYEPTSNRTTLKLVNMSVESYNGQLINTPKMNVLGISYQGKGTGTFSLKTPEFGLGFFSTSEIKGCGCGKNENPSKTELPCTGSVTITKADDKEMQGTFHTTVYSSVGDQIVIGSIYGKFKVLRAN